MNRPYWTKDAPEPKSYPPLQEDLKVDCLVIGGGITGVTSAFLLRKEGLSVALVERDWLGAGDTSHTTAHLTYMTDTRLSELVATFSREEARQAWEAGREAIGFIRQTVEELGIDCGFRTVPGFLAAAYDGDWEKEKRELQEEAEMARAMGFEVSYVEDAPPQKRPAIRFENQALFQPLIYLHALADRASALGVKVYEKTEVKEFEEDSRSVITAEGKRISCDKVVIATHVPLQGVSSTFPAAMFQSKLASYSTYAIGAKIPEGVLPEMIWSDTDTPFLYLRVTDEVGHSLAILGGEDHKTGQEPHTVKCYSRLEDALDAMTPQASIEHRWCGQVVETVDGLPYIGTNEDGCQFIATGFSGTGLTFGTVAALMARDAFTGQESPWKKLFSPGRKKLGALPEYVKENLDFPVRMVTDRMGTPELDPHDLPKGSGRVIRHEGCRIAAYRDKQGDVHALSAICPHLGCVVAWNESEKTWDCPCHGSRFSPEGDLIAGPAERGLEKAKV